MTVLDKQIPYEELLMVCLQVQPQLLPTPAGYHLAENPLDFQDQWADLMAELGFFDDPAKAQRYWQSMEEKDRSFLQNHFWFLCDDQNQLAACCGLWPGRHFENIPLRIHYLGVAQAHQHQGLARWILNQVLLQYQHEFSGPLYLSTQAQSWPAIRLYESCGFIPWQKASRFQTEQEARQAWTRARNWDAQSAAAGKA